MRGLIVQLWPGEPAEGRAVYLNDDNIQPLVRPSVIAFVG